MTIRVVAVDDHPLLLKQLQDDFAAEPDIELVGFANHVDKLIQLVRTTQANVVVLDPGMPDGYTDTYFIQNLLQEFPMVQVLILTGYFHPAYIREVVASGVFGFVIKNDNLSLELPQGVRQIHNKRRFYSSEVIDVLFSGDTLKPDEILTHQQRAVLRFVADGYSNQKIAEVFGVTANRVRNILSAIYSILNVNEDKDLNPRMAAVAKARKMGLLNDDLEPR